MSDIRANFQTSLSPSQLIAKAARKTGANFEYLMQTAARESGFDAKAKASTSSAAGLYQFIEQTWLSMVSRHGEKHGMSEAAKQIELDEKGRFVVTDQAKREEILNLRYNPEIASVMAGELTSDNAAIMHEKIGRQPNTGELYAAHFLGASGASTLINLTESSPKVTAASVFPEAAQANKSVFERDGRKINVAELLGKLTGNVAHDDQTDLQGKTMSYGSKVFASSTPTPPSLVSILTPTLVEALASLDAPSRAENKS